ncbi:MAG: sigma-70 family RNA polymerase sigma factor [Clostridia bacterium]|nr:sigma-70 family RNA polymerase sigma factor [Clostridia bacterium]
MYDNDMKIIERAQNGSKDDMTQLIENNNGLIWSIVRRFSGRNYDVEDLYQIGSIGFIKAIQRFDTSFEVRLSTYAVPYILGEIKRYIRDDGPIKVSRSLKELNVKILELQKMYFNKYGKEIKLEEISKELRISKEEIVMALDSARPVDSIEEAKYKDSKTNKTVSILEQISTGRDEQTEITNKIAVKKLIEELDDKEKEIIMLRYYKRKTQTQVSKILGITQVQVSRIERKILNDMKRKLIV